MRTSKKHNTRKEKANMDKRRIKIAMKVLSKSRSIFRRLISSSTTVQSKGTQKKTNKLMS